MTEQQQIAQPFLWGWWPFPPPQGQQAFQQPTPMPGAPAFPGMPALPAMPFMPVPETAPVEPEYVAPPTQYLEDVAQWEGTGRTQEDRIGVWEE